jgi:hypothetical protein
MIKDTTDYWRNIYFDLEETKTRNVDESSGESKNGYIAFVCGKRKKKEWKLVNQDLEAFQNILIKEFEKVIIERLKIELKNKWHYTIDILSS